MQMAFDFGQPAAFEQICVRLRKRFGRLPLWRTRAPIGQMVKSMISGRTLDAISLDAFDRLVRRYPRWPDMARAAPPDLRDAIAAVTYAEEKSIWLHRTLNIIAAERADFDLGFLGDWPVPRSLAWLERLLGVGRKVSASTLNFSTLHRPAFVIDTHVLRILRRLGFVDPDAGIRAAYDRVMPALAQWSAGELAELHMLLKLLGQTICRPENPDCGNCPLRASCRITTR